KTSGTARPADSADDRHEAATAPGGHLVPCGKPDCRSFLRRLTTDARHHPRYRVIDLLGAGGMGAVYKAEHRVMERIVALKVIDPRLVSNLNSILRFHQEVKAAARLSHPNIVTAYDAEQAGNVHFLVMEYIEGKSLAAIVAKRGQFPLAHSCDYIRQA